MEGPSLVILREELKPFVGQRVLGVSGNTKQPKEELRGLRLEKIETWGKVLFLFFNGPRRKKPLLTKTHFLMFGSYRIDDPKEGRDPRLKLRFKNGTVYFYSCSLRFDADEVYGDLDWKVDLLSPHWDPRHVQKLMAKKTATALCDLFLEQSLFAGSGNIVKNEVLFNIRRHPLTKLGQIPQADWPKLIHAVRDYCGNFYEWKKKFELRRHWQVYRQQRCPLCAEKLVREPTGRMERRSFYCPNHQKLLRTRRRVVVHEVLPMKSPKGVKEKALDH